MSPLTFPCVVTSIEGTKPITRRRAWIGGHDFRALVLAATRHIGSSPETCRYTLFSPEGFSPEGCSPGVSSRGVFLELTDRRVDIDAHVGPMSGPAPPLSLGKDRYWPFDEFLTLLGYHPATGRPLDEAAYVVVVRDSGIWNGAARTPQRGVRETPQQFKLRVEAADRAHIDRVRYEGLHLVRYPVAPASWTARDLERLMQLAYRLLPTSEPRWRESGTISHRTIDPESPAADNTVKRGRRSRRARSGEGSDPRRFCLEVGRGDYVASIQLPCFPVTALAEWLARRSCDIHLHYPANELETPRAIDAAADRALAS